MSSYRILRVGCMGCADIAKRHVMPTLARMPEFQVKAFASRSREKAERFAAEFGGTALEGYESLLERDDIDVVYVPLPTGLHAEWVERLLQSGKHVMVEKSLALHLGNAERLVAVARSNRRALMEHFQFVYHRQTEFVGQLLADQRIGELRALRASFGFSTLDPANFRFDPRLGGGALLDAGAYTLRAAQIYLNEPLHVKGASLCMADDRHVDIAGACMLESESGVLAQTAWGFERYYQCSVELWGRHGRIIQDRAFTAPPGYRAKVTLEQDGSSTTYQLPEDNHFVNLWRHFHGCVVEESFDTSWCQVAAQSRLLDAVRLSALGPGNQ